MANKPKKPTKTNSNTMNSVLTDNKTPPKSRKQIYQENYQKNKEHKKQQRKTRYQQDKETEKAQQKQRYLKKKEQDQLTTKQQSAKYYQAKHIEVLMPFSEYTELSKETKKLWQDFNWTLQVINESITGIVDIMKLEQVAGKLVRHYLETAKSKERNERVGWNLLDYDQQMKLVKYWGRERARIENNFIDEAERLEKQGDSYLKEIERAKFHEERGKVKCECYRCQESKRIQGEIKKELFKEDKTEKEQCPECQKWVKELDEEAGVCKSCKGKYE